MFVFGPLWFVLLVMGGNFIYREYRKRQSRPAPVGPAVSLLTADTRIPAGRATHRFFTNGAWTKTVSEIGPAGAPHVYVEA